jgi:hypothetical protein
MFLYKQYNFPQDFIKLTETLIITIKNLQGV